MQRASRCRQPATVVTPEAMRNPPPAPRLPRRWLALAAGGALALALLLTRPQAGAKAIADLPAYAMSIDGGESAREPSAREPAIAHRDARLRLTARPAMEVDGALDVRVFAVRAGSAREAHCEVRVSSTGSVEVRGRAAELVGDAPGDAELVVLVAREGALSVRAREIASGDVPVPRGVTLARAAIRMRP